MSAILLVALLIIGVGQVASAEGGLPATSSSASFGVRIVQPWIGQLLDRAAGASPTLDGLVDRLACSSLIVHVDDDVPDGARYDGRTRFVAAVRGHRYLRIDIRQSSSASATVGLLAHELQHAVEILEGDIGDGRAFEMLYRQIALPRSPFGRVVFETRKAIAAGIQTVRELGAYGAWPRTARRAVRPRPTPLSACGTFPRFEPTDP